MGDNIPLCRYCGEAIPKKTKRLYFKQERSGTDIATGYTLYCYGPLPQTKAEAQARANIAIVSVQRTKGYSGDGTQIVTDAGIESATVWDGVSYVDDFFCKLDHAAAFGRLAASLGQDTLAHRRALAKRSAGATYGAGAEA